MIRIVLAVWPFPFFNPSIQPEKPPEIIQVEIPAETVQAEVFPEAVEDEMPSETVVAEEPSVPIFVPSIQEIVLESALEDRSGLHLSLNQKYAQHQMSSELVAEIREEIAKKWGHLVVVEIPDQDVSAGTLIFRVSNPTIEKINIDGNRWFSTRQLKNEINLKEGDHLNQSDLSNDIAWINRNPFRHVDAVLTPVDHEKGVDINLVVKDRFPFRFFAGADNTGTEFSSPARLYTGVTWGNLFGCGNLFNYQFTFAPDTREFMAHTLSFDFFLPIKHQLSFFGGWSFSHPEIPNFHSEAKSAQASTRYRIPFSPLYTKPQHELYFGYDYKNLNSNVFFTSESQEIPVVTRSVNLTQFCLGYRWQNAVMLQVETYFSPFSWLPNQTNSVYDDLRPHSRVEYIYAKLACGYTYVMSKNLSFSFLLRGQGSSGALLPSEQFGLGGYNTVRGYEENDFLADNALCFGTEMRFYSASFFKRDKLEALIFNDMGGGRNYDPQVESTKQQFLWSIGPGIRYGIGTYVQFRLDYGFCLHQIFDENRLGRAHIGFTASY